MCHVSAQGVDQNMINVIIFNRYTVSKEPYANHSSGKWLLQSAMSLYGSENSAI